MSKKNYVEANSIRELGKILGVSDQKSIETEIRINIVVAIERVIKKNKWTKAQAAKEMKVNQTVIESIMNGNIGQISTNRLINIADDLGLEIKIKVA